LPRPLKLKNVGIYDINRFNGPPGLLFQDLHPVSAFNLLKMKTITNIGIKYA